MPKIRSDFEDLEKSIIGKSADPRKTKRMERNAVEWFLEKSGRKRPRGKKEALGKEGIKIDDVLHGKQGIKSRLTPGQLFTYKYDAKTKEDLPYWDKNPLVMPIFLYEDGFLGLNFHYLPPWLRARLLGLIMGTMSSKKLSREAKAKITYGLIVSTSRLAIAKPCIKRYLRSHVRSKMVRINPKEWEHVVFLPFDEFQKAPRTKVWKDSIAQING